MKELTDVENEKLTEVLHHVEEQAGEGSQADLDDFDENMVYISVFYDDDNTEDMKVHRSDLNSDKTAEDIASEIG